MNVTSLATARRKYRPVQPPSRDADVEFYIHIGKGGRIEFLQSWVSHACEHHAHDWRGARDVGQLIHGMWWTWMSWDEKDFEEAWRTDPVFSITVTRGGWHLKTSAEYEESESECDNTIERVWRSFWLLRIWLELTKEIGKFWLVLARGKNRP